MLVTPGDGMDGSLAESWQRAPQCFKSVWGLDRYCGGGEEEEPSWKIEGAAKNGGGVVFDTTFAS